MAGSADGSGSWGSWLSSQASNVGVDTNALSANFDKISQRASESAAALKEKASAAAAEAKSAAAAAAERLKKESAQAEELAKLKTTVQQFLQLSGDAAPADADTDELCAMLQKRGLLLVKSAESFRQQAEAACEKGKAYKAQAKEQAAATERERAAKQAMQAKCNAALQRVQQLEAGGGGGAVDLLVPGLAPPPATPFQEPAQMPVAATPAFLHEAEKDLSRKLPLDSETVMLQIVAAGEDSVSLSFKKV